MARKVDVCIIGAGSAGMYAMGQAARRTKDFVVVNSGPLGTTCARVGCMPSKVLIQAADDMAHTGHFAKEGIHGAQHLKASIPEVLAHVRRMRDGFASGPKGKMQQVAKRGQLIDAAARFVAPDAIEVNGERIEAAAFVIAAGSRPVVPQRWRDTFGEDRLLTTDSLFEQDDLPADMAVLGLGAIGLEMGQALSRLGVNITAVDMLDTIGGLTDDGVSYPAIGALREEFDIWLGAPAELEEATDGRIRVKAGDNEVVVDKVLVALGRRPNVDTLNLQAAGVALDERGLPAYDPATMRIGESNLFIAGDANGDRQILHEAADEGRIAGFNAIAVANGQPARRFRRKVPLGIVFSDPNIAVVGQTFRHLDATLVEDEGFVIGERDFMSQGRAMVMQAAGGVLHVYAKKDDGRILGAELAIPRGEHIAHHLAWAIENGLTVADMLALPYYHPVIEEGLQNALHDAYGQLDDAAKVDGIPDLPFADE
ncbi:MAG TPA: dihydrolipoyl dehydrogenase, partial [Thermopetrobacter sp.]|nr:dihydrolipoyl dehydrogenase [Thermopetrobacter sp.]